MKRNELQLVNDIAKPELKKKLREKCDLLLLELGEMYPKSEIDTWAFQVKEAQAFLADGGVSTPFLDAAVKDGESKTDLANLIVVRSAAFSAIAGDIVKFRRETEVLIDGITTLAEANAIEANIEQRT